MYLNLYQAEVEHNEYERRVQAHLYDEMLRKARAERTNALATLQKQCHQLIASLIRCALHLIRRRSNPSTALRSIAS